MPGTLPRPALAADFTPATEADWLKRVADVLKGESFEKKLVRRSADGLAIPPLSARRADAVALAPSRGMAPWKIAARLDHPDAVTANALALEELAGGADMLVLTFAGAPSARGFGLAAPAADVLEQALSGVHADLVALRLESAPFAGRVAAAAMVEFAGSRRLPPQVLEVDFGLCPLADIASTGEWPIGWENITENLGVIIADLRARGFGSPLLRADSRPFHEAGASEAQEVASLLAQGVAYLRALESAGITPGEARGLISFTLTAEVDQLATIAKARALRLAWARVEQALALTPQPLRLHIETAWRMLTRRDVPVNILRNAIAAFAAGIGGADSLAVLSHTSTLGLPDGAARRLARNTSHLLIEESGLARMLDPAAGAGGIEAMTGDLARAAWAEFQRLEATKAGGLAGLPGALKDGSFAARIAETAARRAKEIATRRLPLTGTSEFPDLDESLPHVLLPAPAIAPRGPYPSRRLAEPFEALRDRAEALAARKAAPRIFLANLGSIAGFTPRSMFARAAFEAGGIAAISNDGFAEGEGSDLVALTTAFTASGAAFACLCGSDAAYAEEAQDATIALAASGAEAIFLAGRPGGLEAVLRATGVQDFLFSGCDIVAFLDQVLAQAEART